jgi:MinD superfamily P-loop ATPase
MIIAVASGKGGTGKTTVAVNMAMCLPAPVLLLDCDVEEPNCDIFLEPVIQRTDCVSLAYPIVDENRCNGCGECSSFCQFNAIASLKTKPLVFPTLCHGCGGCVHVCPVDAIAEGKREIGVIEVGKCRHMDFVQGRLEVGQALATPLIRSVKRHVSCEGVTIVDCPPGTSCTVMAAVQRSDYVILVAESTPFGLHDLKLAVKAMRQLGLNFGVVVNRALQSDMRVSKYCESEQIPVLLEIPDDRQVAEAYSRGLLIIEAIPRLRPSFENLCYRILSQEQRIQNNVFSGCGGVQSIS